MRSSGDEPAAATDGGIDLLVVAGEASGDLHGASLARALRARAPRVRCFGVGGDRMEAVGVELLYHMKSLAVVGITEVLRHLVDVYRALGTLTRAAARRNVDGVVLIDYPDFNLTLARRLRKRLPDVPIVYYISPQVWAWRESRIQTIARLVDAMLVILPFEKELYADVGLDVEFVGHPLLDVVRFDSDRAAFAIRHDVSEAADWVALLPGSRKAEVERLLPRMAEAAALLADRPRPGAGGIAAARRTPPHFLVPVSAGVDREVYRRCLQPAREHRARVHLIADDYYASLQHAVAAAVCSGTATLEAALAGTPMVVVYRTSWLTYNLAKSLVRVPDIALVNLIAGRRAVPELVQGDVTAPRMVRELESLLYDEARRRRVGVALEEVRERLGEPGASGRAADAVLRLIRGTGDLSASAVGDVPAPS